MSLAKAAFSGVVYREPQMRFTTNNVPITYFTFNIGQNDDEEDLIRIRAIGKNAEVAEKTIKRGERLVVEGNLTIVSIKDESGAEKKIVELAMISFEKIAATNDANAQTYTAEPQSESVESESLVKFTNDGAEDLIGEDEIPF